MYINQVILFVVLRPRACAAALNWLDAQADRRPALLRRARVILGGRLGCIAVLQVCHHLAHPAEILSLSYGGAAWPSTGLPRRAGSDGAFEPRHAPAAGCHRLHRPAGAVFRPRRWADGQFHQRQNSSGASPTCLGDDISCRWTATPAATLAALPVCPKASACFFILWWFCRRFTAARA